jgi:hypothetical protein
VRLGENGQEGDPPLRGDVMESDLGRKDRLPGTGRPDDEVDSALK